MVINCVFLVINDDFMMILWCVFMVINDDFMVILWWLMVILWWYKWWFNGIILVI